MIQLFKKMIRKGDKQLDRQFSHSTAITKTDNGYVVRVLVNGHYLQMDAETAQSLGSQLKEQGTYCSSLNKEYKS